MSFIALLIAGKLLCGSVEHSTTEGRVGVEVDYSSGVIHYVHRHSPAKFAGIKRGDIVLEVDGVPDNCHHIHGEPGTSVRLKMRRRHQSDFELDVMRTERWRIGIL